MERTHKVLRQFINNVPGFKDPADRIEFQMAHCIGKVTPETETNHYAISVVFREGNSAERRI